jgi:glucosamine kinase
MTALLLGVDGGGTLCRARLSDHTGRVLGEGLGGPANIRFGLEESFEAARSAAMQCLSAAGLAGTRLERTIACLGFAGAGEPVLLAAAQNHAHPYRDTVVTTDAHIACVGAHHGKDGGAIIAGTGSCGWAVIGEKQHRIGGWGFPISDEGSGAWLGCETIRRVLWAEDGRIPSSALLTAIAQRFRNDPHLMVAWMTQAKPRDFASLAPVVVEHAVRGDAVGRELLTLAAEHIAALARRLIALGAPRVALVGGLAPHLAPLLAPDVAPFLVAPAGDALDGALHLARQRARDLGLV